jgi:hypothetical protein
VKETQAPVAKQAVTKQTVAKHPLHVTVVGLAAAASIAVAIPASAHHGWGSYEASSPVTVEGEVLTSKYENPHVTLTIKGADKIWTVTLAPTSRMEVRGASKEMVAVGQTVKAFGYPSRVEKDEMRAERISVGDKTIEMR